MHARRLPVSRDMCSRGAAKHEQPQRAGQRALGRSRRGRLERHRLQARRRRRRLHALLGDPACYVAQHQPRLRREPAVTLAAAHAARGGRAWCRVGPPGRQMWPVVTLHSGSRVFRRTSATAPASPHEGEGAKPWLARAGLRQTGHQAAPGATPIAARRRPRTARARPPPHTPHLRPGPGQSQRARPAAPQRPARAAWCAARAARRRRARPRRPRRPRPGAAAARAPPPRARRPPP
jgi:hypothetical protein